MSKRNIWSYEETLEMLNIMQEQETPKAMNGRPFRKDKAFWLVNVEMVRRGYTNRDSRQIEYRWRNLKRGFVEMQKNVNNIDTSTFQYYDEIDLLLKGKSSPEGNPQADSSKTNLVDATQEEQMEKNPKTDVESEHLQGGHSQRRSLRTTKGKSRRFNKEITPTTSSATQATKPTDNEVYSNEKKLITYQFELYNRMQRESDEKFLQMCRQSLEESNEMFRNSISQLFATQNK
ncbi:uncharacterized protein LOC131210884 [Anopheles bellator]|uniref:uncharacterized protein LOC131210884 n=1 Tax=Anopheles bellator TaxID=139047 RepID=UPI002648F482|nr:uncharacterized protein LOC131210884 [Anopheles bellator]